MTDSKDLTVVKIGAIPEVVFSPDTVKMNAVKDDYPISKIPLTIDDDESYAIVKDGAKAHQKTRTKIEADHKELKKPYRDVGLQLDTAKNLMLEELKPIEEAYKKAKKDFDDIENNRLAEEERLRVEAIDKITNKIAWINGYPNRLIGKPSSEVYEAIEQLKADNLEWSGAMIEAAKTVSENITSLLENLHTTQLASENAERIAAEELVKRKAEEKKVAEERAAEQKLLDEERAKMDEEKEKLQAEKDKLQKEKDDIERENAEAKAEVAKLKADKKEADRKAEQAKIDEENRVKAAKDLEKERLADEKKAKALAAQRLKDEEEERIKAEKLANEQAAKLEAELDKRREETINHLAEMMGATKPANKRAKDMLASIEAGEVPNLIFQ